MSELTQGAGLALGEIAKGLLDKLQAMQNDRDRLAAELAAARSEGERDGLSQVVELTLRPALEAAIRERDAALAQASRLSALVAQARTLLGNVIDWGWYEHDETLDGQECPEDDTCDCPWIAATNAFMRDSAALADGSSAKGETT